MARVFRGDEIDGSQDPLRARREILHVPDRRGHEVERPGPRLVRAKLHDRTAERTAVIARSMAASSTSRCVTARK